MKQKTKFFKFIAFAISFILLLTVFSPLSMAETSDQVSSSSTGTITVNGLEDNVTAYLYQIVTVNYNDAANQPEDEPYSWVSAVENWIKDHQTYSDYEDPEDFYDITQSDSSKSDEFYSNLAAAIKAGNVSLTYKSETSSSGEVTFTNCSMGTYLIIIENGYKVYSPVVVNLIPEYDDDNEIWTLETEVETTAKSTDLQISKTVEDATVVTAGTNETISFTIEADIPNYPEGSTATKYYISDKLSDGLTLVDGSITVSAKKTGGEAIALTANTDYYLSYSTTRPSNTQTTVDFLIEFVYGNISGYDTIIVEYSAKLSQSSTTNIGAEGNTNNAYLDYSNNPYDNSSMKGKDATDVIVYTYGAEITKVNKSNVALPGATFELQNSGGTAYEFVGNNGVYYLASSSDSGTTTELEVDASGKLYIYGLNVGTYYLVETEAPEGYNKSNVKGVITITDSDPDGILDDAEDGDETGIYKLSYVNTSGFQLPVTGGMGIAIFIASGIVLIGLGITLFAFVIKKRKTN